jgi:hypothetical protein
MPKAILSSDVDGELPGVICTFTERSVMSPTENHGECRLYAVPAMKHHISTVNGVRWQRLDARAHSARNDSPIAETKRKNLGNSSMKGSICN